MFSTAKNSPQSVEDMKTDLRRISKNSQYQPYLGQKFNFARIVFAIWFTPAAENVVAILVLQIRCTKIYYLF